MAEDTYKNEANNAKRKEYGVRVHHIPVYAFQCSAHRTSHSTAREEKCT